MASTAREVEVDRSSLISYDPGLSEQRSTIILHMPVMLISQI